MSAPFHVSDKRRDTIALAVLFIANLAVLGASWKHLVSGFAQLEVAGDYWAAVAAASAVDGAIIALSYSLSHRRLSERAARPLIYAVGFLVVLSMSLNIDQGVSVVLSKVSGQPVGGLWRVFELQSLDWFVLARVFLYRGSLPVTNLLLSIAVDRVARAASVVDEHEPVVAPGPYAPPPDISALHRHEYAAPPPSQPSVAASPDWGPWHHVAAPPPPLGWGPDNEALPDLGLYGKSVEVPREAIEHPPRSVGEWADIRREEERASAARAADVIPDRPHGIVETPGLSDSGDVEVFGGASAERAENLRRVLEYLASDTERPPTVVGISDALDFSERSGWRYVAQLKDLGYVTTDPLAITPQGRSVVQF